MFSTARLAVIARVAERGTIVGAAEELHLTPSAVSHQLSRLEKELGVPLVERGTDILTGAARLRHTAGQSARPGLSPVGRPAATTVVPST